MPELPEVETVCRGIAPVLVGARLVGVTPRREGLRVPFPKDLAAVLTGHMVTAVRRRAKYALLEMENEAVVILHLGMSGRVRVDLPEGAWPALEKHDHLVLETDRGARLVLNDARRFGMVLLTDRDGLDRHPMLANLGPEPLGNQFDASYLAATLAKRKTSLKAALLDQHVIAGLGNIYVCEALYRARLLPQRIAGSIDINQAERLVSAVRQVLSEAIVAGGSSLRDHAQVTGELGYFQHRFQVYGREGEPCRGDGCNDIVRRVVQAGRSSFYCPACQGQASLSV